MIRVIVDLSLHEAHYLRSILNSKKGMVTMALEDSEPDTSVYSILQSSLETVCGLLDVVDSAIEDSALDG